MTQDQVDIIAHDCTGVAAVMAQTRHSFAKHTHEAFGIGLMHSGAQQSASGRGMVEAGAGNIITVNPREVHDGHPIGDNPRGWNMLYFAPDLIADAAKDMQGGARPQYEFTRPVMDSPAVTSCFIALFEATTRGTDRTARLRRDEMLLLLLHHALITPMLIGNRLKINSVAVAIVLAIALWGWHWGFVGILVAVPLLIVASVISNHVEGLGGLRELLGPHVKAP